MEFYALAQKNVEVFDTEEKSRVKAYVDGINDFINNVGIFGQSARLLPPEFYFFGMTGEKLEPFTEADVML